MPSGRSSVLVLHLAGDRPPEPGMPPGGGLTFFASPKKVSKERRPCWLRPLRFATGRPAPRRCRGALQNSLRASRCARTAAASQITKQLLPHAAQLPPRHRRVAGASRRDFGRAIASLGLQSQAQGQGCAAALLTLSRVPSVCAEERSGWRIRARDCLSEASSSETPPAASTAGCPQRSGGTQTVGSPFLCLLSFGEAKESRSPAGAKSRPLHLNPEQGQAKPQKKAAAPKGATARATDDRRISRRTPPPP